MARPIEAKGGSDGRLAETAADLRTARFVPKRVLAVGALGLSLLRNSHEQFEAAAPSALHVTEARRRFAVDARRAIAYLVHRAKLAPDATSIARFLHRYAVAEDLDARQVGRFLGARDNNDVLRAYLGLLDMAGLAVHQALRLFLGTFRMPGDVAMIDYLLTSVARHWHSRNAATLSFSAEAAVRLVFALLSLNVKLHSTAAFSPGPLDGGEAGTSPGVTRAGFIADFARENTATAVSVAVLGEAYDAVAAVQFESAGVATRSPAAAAEAASDDVLRLEPSRLPGRLMVGQASDAVTLHLPASLGGEDGSDDNEPLLVLKLHSSTLHVSVAGALDATLCFTRRQRAATFRVTAGTIGHHKLCLFKAGGRLARSAALPFSAVVLGAGSVQLQNTLQLVHEGADSQRRKYQFGMADAEAAKLWHERLARELEQVRARPGAAAAATATAAHLTQALEGFDEAAGISGVELVAWAERGRSV